MFECLLCFVAKLGKLSNLENKIRHKKNSTLPNILKIGPFKKWTF